ncbi:MAG TPA: hypothetical protein VN611_05595 [Patescibacteria group bacterium]|nr:hypothetical protein [Patescibacteria group bacterium]
MLSTNWNPEPEMAKRFINFEGYGFSPSFVDSACEEVECDEPEIGDSYSDDLHACNELHSLRAYVDSDAEMSY